MRDNGQNPPPPESLHFERKHLKCQGCDRIFENFVIEEIDDLVQLRCGEVLIAQTKLVCLYCGTIFFWNIAEKNLARMAVKYGELMAAIKGYNPE